MIPSSSPTWRSAFGVAQELSAAMPVDARAARRARRTTARTSRPGRRYAAAMALKLVARTSREAGSVRIPTASAPVSASPCMTPEGVPDHVLGWLGSPGNATPMRITEPNVGTPREIALAGGTDRRLGASHRPNGSRDLEVRRDRDDARIPRLDDRAAGVGDDERAILPGAVDDLEPEDA